MHAHTPCATQSDLFVLWCRCFRGTGGGSAAGNRRNESTFHALLKYFLHRVVEGCVFPDLEDFSALGVVELEKDPHGTPHLQAGHLHVGREQPHQELVQVRGREGMVRELLPDGIGHSQYVRVGSRQNEAFSRNLVGGKKAGLDVPPGNIPNVHDRQPGVGTTGFHGPVPHRFQETIRLGGFVDPQSRSHHEAGVAHHEVVGALARGIVVAVLPEIPGGLLGHDLGVSVGIVADARGGVPGFFVAHLSRLGKDLRRVGSIDGHPIDARRHDDTLHTGFQGRIPRGSEDVQRPLHGRIEEHFFLLSRWYSKAEGRSDVEDHRATFHRFEVGSLLHQIGLEEAEAVAAFAAGQQIPEAPETRFLGGIADGAVDGESFLEELFHEDATDVSGRTGDHDGRGSIDIHLRMRLLS
mmetsp:Transcript_9358/g.19639  ORF Transcript_9358/g.19639 Transcript_9358/m.19639 type:complete len:410 (+) Transcript_9358:265-1494(+)